ncbi:hypothetical protein [Enterococcus rotai]|uniref:hypothetical protein n=1 Tax=Enterococcus rotai TaxID=118060 RepID=UPI0032B53208
MDKKKWVKTGAITLGMVASLLVGTKLSGADEKKVYIPDDEVRSTIVRELNGYSDPETGEELVIENELPTVRQMNQLENLSFYNVSSFEGLQHAKNAKRLYYAPEDNEVIDFRPIAKMEKLEEFFCYSFNQTTTPFDISAFGELKHLNSLNFGYNVSIFDFSPLSNVKTLKSLHAYGGGMVEFPAVYVDQTTKSFKMKHPVKYSTQFDGGNKEIEAMEFAGNEEALGNVDVLLKEDKVIVSNISKDAAKIHLRFVMNSTDNNFLAVTDCIVPIIWE